MPVPVDPTCHDPGASKGVGGQSIQHTRRPPVWPWWRWAGTRGPESMGSLLGGSQGGGAERGEGGEGGEGGAAGISDLGGFVRSRNTHKAR